jgi:hypothetical protein
MYHMADLIEELDVEFMDEVDCEEFLAVPWFISWGWCDNCDFIYLFIGWNVEVCKVYNF